MTIDPAALGFVQPSGDDLISNGDDAISANARAAAALYERTTAEAAAQVRTATQWLEPSRNMLNPDEFLPDHFLAGGSLGGDAYPLDGYTASGYVPVRPGQTYTTTARAWSAFDGFRALVQSSNANQNHAPIQITVPAGAVWLRLAWSSGQTPTMQLEAGSTQTPWQPFEVQIPHLALGDSTAPALTATVRATDQSLIIDTRLGGKSLRLEAGPALRPDANAVFNIGKTWHNGQNVHIAGTPDEITPLRTEVGTVGANHGFAGFQSWASHDKTPEDLGSIWSDGAREWTLVAITPAGRAHFAPDPGAASTGEVTLPTTLAGDMQHVSGATHTATLPQSGAARGADQVYPAVTRHHLAYFVDGVRITDGSRPGATVEVRESYEIIDYRAMLATARANPGRPFSELSVAGAIRVQLSYTFTAGGACVVRTELTELLPSRLTQIGFVQAQALAGATVHRTVPGVTGWATPVPLSEHSTNVLVTPSDLISATVPPVMSLDDNGTVAFALGYQPWQEGAASSPARIGASLSRYWDLRSTDKSYPIAFMSAAPGWDRITATGYRVYLVPDDAAALTNAARDAHAAAAALEALTSI